MSRQWKSYSVPSTPEYSVPVYILAFHDFFFFIVVIMSASYPCAAAAADSAPVDVYFLFLFFLYFLYFSLFFLLFFIFFFIFFFAGDRSFQAPAGGTIARRDQEFHHRAWPRLQRGQRRKEELAQVEAALGAGGRVARLQQHHLLQDTFLAGGGSHRQAPGTMNWNELKWIKNELKMNWNELKLIEIN